MNSSKPYGFSGDHRTSSWVPPRFVQQQSPYPSPRPSPFRLRGAPKRRFGATAAGRGRPYRKFVTSLGAALAGRAFEQSETVVGCSLSPGERVRGIELQSTQRLGAFLKYSSFASLPAAPNVSQDK